MVTFQIWSSPHFSAVSPYSRGSGATHRRLAGILQIKSLQTIQNSPRFKILWRFYVWKKSCLSSTSIANRTHGHTHGQTGQRKSYPMVSSSHLRKAPSGRKRKKGTKQKNQENVYSLEYRFLNFGLSVGPWFQFSNVHLAFTSVDPVDIFDKFRFSLIRLGN